MATRRVLSAAQQQAVAAEYRDSLISIAELAKKYECSGRAIWLVLKERGVPPRRQAEFPRRFAIPIAKHGEVVAAYVAGDGVPSVAKRFGYSARAVRSVVKAAGVHFRRSWAREPGPERLCGACKVVKPIGEFSRNQSQYGAKSRSSWCRTCRNAYVRPWKFLKRTGISVDQFEALKRKQRGRCALCLKVKKLNVDHDHKTRVIRGLLCTTCNQMMRAMDDAKWAGRAIAYRARNTGWLWPATKKTRRT